MSPLYVDGDILEADPCAYEYIDPRAGDSVLVEHPYIDDYLLVKKIHTVTSDKISIRGVNEDFSTDSACFGMLSKTKIRAKIVAKIDRSQMSTESADCS